jgi:hypothetical protein
VLRGCYHGRHVAVKLLKSVDCVDADEGLQHTHSPDSCLVFSDGKSSLSKDQYTKLKTGLVPLRAPASLPPPPLSQRQPSAMSVATTPVRPVFNRHEYEKAIRSLASEAFVMQYVAPLTQEKVITRV